MFPWIVTYVYWEMEIVGQGCDLAGGEVFVKVTFLETAFHLFLAVIQKVYEEISLGEISGCFIV